MPEPSQRALQDKLLAAIDELIAAYESAVAEDAGTEPSDEVTVAAGPFTSFAALRDFERALSEIPGVLEVNTRGYEGADRAIIDVSLAPGGEPPPSGTTQ